MIFQHTWEWIADKSPHTSEPKTQTRWLIKAGEWQPRWKVGKTYSVQRKQGEAALWTNHKGDCVTPRYADRIYYYSHKYRPIRIRIIDIRREDVREISNEDIRAEGFADYKGFMLTWISIHDKPAYRELTVTEVWYGGQYFDQRPASRYQAWVLAFEVCK